MLLGVDLGPHLTQCCQCRGLPACQVSPCSIQPFGHNTPTLQTDRQDKQRSDSIRELFYKWSPKNGGKPIPITIVLRERERQENNVRNASVNLPLHHKVQKFSSGSPEVLFWKSRSSLLAPDHPGGPGKRAVKRLWCGGGNAHMVKQHQ